jgi:hypothetical protein
VIKRASTAHRFGSLIPQHGFLHASNSPGDSSAAYLEKTRRARCPRRASHQSHAPPKRSETLAILRALVVLHGSPSVDNGIIMMMPPAMVMWMCARETRTARARSGAHRCKRANEVVRDQVHDITARPPVWRAAAPVGTPRHRPEEHAPSASGGHSPKQWVSPRIADIDDRNSGVDGVPIRCDRITFPWFLDPGHKLRWTSSRRRVRQGSRLRSERRIGIMSALAGAALTYVLGKSNQVVSLLCWFVNRR